MSKFSSIYICQQCGFRTTQFLGRCPECGTWNSLVETVEESQNANRKTQNSSRATKLPSIVNLASVERQNYQRKTTGIGEFDRVLGGGIVGGSVVLVAGDPGIGKSTLLLQLALNLNTERLGKTQKPDKSEESENQKVRNSGNSETLTVRSSGTLSHSESFRNVLYVAGEESAHQIKIRAERINPQVDLAVLNETDVDIIIGVIREGKGNWGLVIIDSIQTLQTEDLNGVAGSVGQVRESAHRLQRLAKELHIPIFIVGHVTKEGTVAGPKTLEHLVDVVLSLEGEQTSNFRVLRSTKNRFGPTDEVGIFEMESAGMVEVSNPSKLFLDTRVAAPGSVVVATMTGLRPLLVEIQALVSKSFLPVPRRTGAGIDNNRLQLLVAVLSKRLGLPLFDQDIFVNVTGGLKLNEPAVDLGVALAIVSSFKDQSLPAKSVVVGEVGLLGEIRVVRELKKRISEAKKLGYTQVISPENAKSLSEAVKLALA